MDGDFRMKRIDTVAVIGAMEAEIDSLKNLLEAPQTHRFGSDIVIYSGGFAGRQMVLCLSGIGKVNAAIATTLLIERFNPDCVINTGSAGGVGDGLKIGDVLIGSQSAHHDADVTAFGYQYGQLPGMPPRFDSDETLMAAAEKAAAAFQAASVRRGLVVSGDSFVHSESELARIRSRFADVAAVEMEAAAIAQTCTRLQKPFVIIRAVSDSASDEAQVSFETFLQTAAVHSAQMVQDLIRAL